MKNLNKIIFTNYFNMKIKKWNLFDFLRKESGQ